MADGLPFKWVKLQKPQKAHLHPLRDVCVQNQRNPEICSRNEMLTDRQTDIRAAAKP